MNNEERIERAIWALGQYGDEVEGECRVNDLLTDLRHYCFSADIDFGVCLDVSDMHFQAEHTDEE